jgi:hypothetical protein
MGCSAAGITEPSALAWLSTLQKERSPSSSEILPQRHWMFGRIFSLYGRERYRELRPEMLGCPHHPSRGCSA